MGKESNGAFNVPRALIQVDVCVSVCFFCVCVFVCMHICARRTDMGLAGLVSISSSLGFILVARGLVWQL